MIDSLVIATDGSESGERAVAVGLDLAERFDAAVHALYVVDEREVGGAPADLRADFEGALRERGEAAVGAVREAADREVTTTVREGRPASEISRYAEENDLDAVAMGTRGRHGEHEFHLGSVAEAVVRDCPVPVLTVRRLDAESGIYE